MYKLVIIFIFAGCNFSFDNAKKTKATTTAAVNNNNNNNIKAINEEHASLTRKRNGSIAEAKIELSTEEKQEISQYNLQYFEKNNQIIDNCFFEADLSNKNFSNQNFIIGSNNPDFKYANIENTKFVNANLERAFFGNKNLKNANFTNAKIGNVNMIGELAIQNLIFDNADNDNTNGYPYIQTKIMQQSSFKNAKLKGAKFKVVVFMFNDFSGADLTGSIFDIANFTNNIFKNTNLSNSKIIIQKNEEQPNPVTNNNFENVILENTTFVIPSYLDIDTFKNSLMKQGIKDLSKIKIEVYESN